MAKQTAEVTVERPYKTATIRFALRNAVRGKAGERLVKKVEGVNGVDNADMEGVHTLVVEVATAHVRKTDRLISVVLRAIGASQVGETKESQV